MKLTLFVLASLALVLAHAADASHIRTTTEMTCPRVCPYILLPVCAQVSNDQYIRYSSPCDLRKCECAIDMRLKRVPMFKCRDAVWDMCPLRLARSDSSAQSTQETQSEESSASHY